MTLPEPALDESAEAGMPVLEAACGLWSIGVIGNHNFGRVDRWLAATGMCARQLAPSEPWCSL